MSPNGNEGSSVRGIISLALLPSVRYNSERKEKRDSDSEDESEHHGKKAKKARFMDN